MKPASLRGWPLAFTAVHALGHVVLGRAGWLNPWELFNLGLLVTNGILALLIAKGRVPLLMGSAVLLLNAAHGLVGHRLAPDSLTSGALLFVSLLTVYVAWKIFEERPLRYGIVFTLSYFALFVIFIIRLSHAEPLFLLALMGLCATGRDFRLLAWFWALVLAFTIFQPYAWETFLLMAILLRALFSARIHPTNPPARIGLVIGLLALGIVLLPVLALLLSQSTATMAAELEREETRRAILLTVATASIATLLLAAVGIPLAYALSRLDFRGKTLVLALMDIPIIIPQSAAGIALLSTFGRNQPLGSWLASRLGFAMDGHLAGIVLAQFFTAFPFLVKPALAAFEAVPPDLELAARHLGANAWGAFRHLVLPLASRGLFLAAILGWARAAGEFGAVYFMTADPPVAPIAIFYRFERQGLAETTPFVATLLIASLALFFLLQYTARRIPTLHAHRHPSA